jgi:hypothetical protein
MIRLLQVAVGVRIADHARRCGRNPRVCRDRDQKAGTAAMTDYDAIVIGRRRLRNERGSMSPSLTTPIEPQFRTIDGLMIRYADSGWSREPTLLSRPSAEGTV